MSKRTKKTLVPNLRFAKFRDTGEWLFMNGNLVFDQITNKNHNSDIPILAITQEFGAIPREKIDYNVSVTDKSIESYKVIEIGDFIISLRSFQGGIEYSDYKGICSPAYIILRKKNNDDDVNHYFKQYFKTGKFIQDLNRDIEGIRDGKMVSYKQFSNLLLPRPSREEQQKIADCLSSIDELITAQSQKLDGLKAHKKGLMQQLFPAEGENLPQLRFPEFLDAGEWIENTLGEIATFAKGKGVSKTEVSSTGSQPCIRYGELYTQYKETINSVISYTDISPSDLVLSQANDVIIPASGETQIDIATASCVLNSGIALGGDLNIIRSKMNGVFLSYYLNNAKKKAIAELAQGISVIHLYSSQLKTLKINVPNIAEQQKIADCLSSIDELITAIAQKLDALKTHKKGLMQQLFPLVEGEV